MVGGHDTVSVTVVLVMRGPKRACNRHMAIFRIGNSRICRADRNDGSVLLIKQQRHRLHELCDGGGLSSPSNFSSSFSLRRLLSILITQIKHILYIGTFKVITSNSKECMNSLGMQQILLIPVLCDLIIQDNAGSSYPEPITTMSHARYCNASVL